VSEYQHTTQQESNKSNQNNYSMLHNNILQAEVDYKEQKYPEAIQRLLAEPFSASPQDLQSLHPFIGNRLLGQIIQAKLSVGPAKDHFEQEADYFAKQVTKDNAYSSRRGKPAQPKSVTLVSRQTSPQSMPSNSNGGFEAAQEMESQLKSSKGRGNQLSDNTRNFVESQFGSDFSKVRVHTDYQAGQMTQELGAEAFTHGNDIYMAKGRYQPESNAGQQLLAHELTHVVQQGGSSSGMQSSQTIQCEYTDVAYTDEKYKKFAKPANPGAHTLPTPQQPQPRVAPPLPPPRLPQNPGVRTNQPTATTQNTAARPLPTPPQAQNRVASPPTQNRVAPRLPIPSQAQILSVPPTADSQVNNWQSADSTSGLRSTSKSGVAGHRWASAFGMAKSPVRIGSHQKPSSTGTPAPPVSTRKPDARFNDGPEPFRKVNYMTGASRYHMSDSTRQKKAHHFEDPIKKYEREKNEVKSTNDPLLTLPKQAKYNNEMNPDGFWSYQTENQGASKNPTYYQPDNQPNPYALNIKGGKLQKNGRTMDTKGAVPSSLKDNFDRHLFTMGGGGEIYSLDATEEKQSHKNHRIHHTTMTGGRETAAAGEMKINEGRLDTIADSSGHYHPGTAMTYQALKKFESSGMDLSATGVELQDKGFASGAKGKLQLSATELMSYRPEMEKALAQAQAFRKSNPLENLPPDKERQGEGANESQIRRILSAPEQDIRRRHAMKDNMLEQLRRGTAGHKNQLDMDTTASTPLKPGLKQPSEQDLLEQRYLDAKRAHGVS